jgi:hypothetical protein
MKSWLKLGIGATGVGIAGWATHYILKMKRTNAEMEVVNTVRVHKVSFAGISFKVNTTIKNPTEGHLSIKQPFVKLLYKDATIGSSQVSGTDIEISSHAEKSLEPIMIQVPISGLFSLGADLLKAVTGSGQSVKLNVRMITTIRIGLLKKPFDKTQEVTLIK